MDRGAVPPGKEVRVKTEPPDSHEMKDFAENTMNELLGWYGYDKVDEQDTEKLSLPQFASKESTTIAQQCDSISRSSSDTADSTVREGSSPGVVASELAAQHKALVSALNNSSDSTSEQQGTGGQSSGSLIVCGWCQKTGLKLFTLKTSTGTKVFCSEVCFTQCRRASFKKSKACDWCKHIRHTVNYVDFQDGEQQLQFCSQKCLNQYKMNIFCRETQEHLQQIKGSEVSSVKPKSEKQILITPELWMQQNSSVDLKHKKKVEGQQSGEVMEMSHPDSTQDMGGLEPLAIEVKPITDRHSHDGRNVSAGERREHISRRDVGMESTYSTGGGSDTQYKGSHLKGRRSRSRDSVSISAATSPVSSHLSSSPNVTVNPTPPAIGAAAPDQRALLGALGGGFPPPPFFYPGLLQAGGMPGFLPPSMMLPSEQSARGPERRTPEGNSTPRPGAGQPHHPYMLPHLPPGMMPPPPPGFLPGMGLPMPPLPPGLLGTPPVPGLPPNTLLAPYPVPIPVPFPVPIVIPVKTDKDLKTLLNMYKTKPEPGSDNKDNERERKPASSYRNIQSCPPSASRASANHGKTNSSPQARHCPKAEALDTMSPGSTSSQASGCHSSGQQSIQCACCQQQRPSAPTSPSWTIEPERTRSPPSHTPDGKHDSGFTPAEMENGVIDLSKDKHKSESPDVRRHPSPLEPGAITIVPTPPGVLGDQSEPGLLPIMPLFLRPEHLQPGSSNGGHLLPPRDHSYSSRRSLILDAPGGRRERSGSPPPEKRILLRSPSREAQFKRRCLRRSIKSK